MGTYDYTVGSTTPSQLDTGKLIVLKRVMNAAAIIASDATLTSNAKITAGDIINAIDVPAGFRVLFTAINVTSAGTAGNTVDVGENTTHADGFQDGVDIVTTGYSTTLSTDDYSSGMVFGSADTIDVKYVADEITGSFTLYVAGFLMA